MYCFLLIATEQKKFAHLCIYASLYISVNNKKNSDFISYLKKRLFKTYIVSTNRLVYKICFRHLVDFRLIILDFYLD